MSVFFTGCNTGSISGKENVYAIIPAPVSIKEMPGNFTFNKNSEIVLTAFNDENKLAADFLAALVKNPTGLGIPVIQGHRASSGSVLMSIDSSVINTEGYTITVNPKRIIIKAGSGAGLFYAVQTIRQLLPPEVERDSVVNNITLKVPCCEITDEPVFGYRGMHLDVGRHLFPVEYIKRYIDMIALHKMNTFHWHLTEDQGWRIEIKKYPELTAVGGFRKETVVGRAGKRPAVYDGKPYGGFYSQKDVKEIVVYARSKFITVIPEIEMPGHSLAALAAYPELSCTGGPFEVGKTWGIFDDVYCAGKEETFKFLEDVLTEVIDLFPGKYIHIGGDECPKTRWVKCPLCQKRIKDEGLKDEKELQSYFIKRMEKFLISKEKRLIGWDEILEGGLAPEATVMSWRGVAGGIEAAKQGHDVIMSPNKYVYLDYYQCEPEGQPLAIGGYLPLENVYSFDPRFVELSPEEQKHILGLQGNVWTEYMNTPQQIEYMAYPRMFAISETGWTPGSKKDFEDFLARFGVQRMRYDRIGINYFKGEYRNTREIKK
ncbi:MAG: beta-N-acetylglucosaminidase [Odoribacter sp.]|nr:beta-N-acetylglucosaminidase [Odoribacter sp.]